MKVAELAHNFNVFPEKLYDFYEYIQTPIPHKLDFELSEVSASPKPQPKKSRDF